MFQDHSAPQEQGRGRDPMPEPQFEPNATPDPGLEDLVLPRIGTAARSPAVQTVSAELSADTAPGYVTRLYRGAISLADRGLNKLAADPKAEASLAGTFGSMGLDLIPIVGPLKKYADARALFAEDDPLLKAEGRKLCVIAVMEAAFDIGTMGGSLFVPDEALTYLRAVRDYQRRARKITNGAKLFPDPLSLAAGALLKIPGVQLAIDGMLKFAVQKGEISAAAESNADH